MRVPEARGQVCSEDLGVCLISSRTDVSKLPQVEVQQKTRAKGSKMRVEEEVMGVQDALQQSSGECSKRVVKRFGGKSNNNGHGYHSKT